MSIKALQTRLGVAADGIAGRGTFTALFIKCGAGPVRAAELALAANVHFRTTGILDNLQRLAHFMAQLMHESANFRYMEEIASGAAYENRADLGNVQPGDGVRFKGRGPIQITGRANYRKFGRQIGIDIENHPEIAAVPSVGLMLACAYWCDRELNAKADADDVVGITKAINGGTNGLADRKQKLGIMKGLLL